MRSWSPKTVAVYERAFGNAQPHFPTEATAVTKTHLETWVG
jgi:hypothetical protein